MQVREEMQRAEDPRARAKAQAQRTYEDTCETAKAKPRSRSHLRSGRPQHARSQRPSPRRRAPSNVGSPSESLMGSWNATIHTRPMASISSSVNVSRIRQPSSASGLTSLRLSASARILDVMRSLSIKSAPLRTAISVVTPLVGLKSGDSRTSLAHLESWIPFFSRRSIHWGPVVPSEVTSK